MSLIEPIAQWCAVRPLASVVIFYGLVTVPTAYGLERLVTEETDANEEKIEDVREEVDDEVPGIQPTTPGDDEAPSGPTTSTVIPDTTQPPTVTLADEQIIRVIAEFCQENDCRPVFVDEREAQEAEIQDPEPDDPERQDPEVQDPEIQEAPIPGPTGATGAPGPACPAGYSLRQVRIPSVSNQMIFIICARG